MTGKPSYKELTQRISELEKLVLNHDKVTPQNQQIEQQFKTVFESANVGKSITLPDGTINVNSAFADMLGYTREELETFTWQELTPAGEIDRIQEAISPILNGSSDSTRFDKRYLHKNGSFVWADVSASAQRDNQGNLLHFITTIVDITERRKAEEGLQASNDQLNQSRQELLKSESFLNSIIDQSPNPMWISDSEGTLIRVNKACLELLNLTPEDVMGKYNIMNDNLVIEQGFLPAVKNVFEKGEIARFEIVWDSSQIKQLELKNPVSVILDVNIFPIRDENGKTTNAVIQHIDITERKQVEIALKESEANLISLISNRNESIWSIDTNYNYLIFNNFFSDEYQRAFNIELKKGLNVLDQMPSDLRSFWKQKYDEALAGKQISFEFSNQMPDALYYFEVSLNPTYIDDTITGVSGISINITDRKLSEKTLCESAANMSAIIENTQDSIWTINTAYEIVYMNSAWKEAFLQSFGVRLETGMVVLDQLPEPLKSIWKKRYDRTLANERFEIIEAIELETHTLYVEIQYNPILVNDVVVGASVFAKDITERKQVEVDLQKSEERFRILSSNVSEGIMIHKDGRILDLNQAFADMAGIANPKDLIGTMGMRSLPLTKESAALIQSHMASGSTDVYDIELIGADGKIIPAETMGTNITYMDQEARLIRMRNISDRKQAESNRLTLEKRLLQTQKLESLGVLAGGIAHDFNNILMGILGYADLALSDLGPHEPAREYVQGINDSSRQAAELVKQMLAYSGKGKFSLEPINLNHLIQDTVPMLTISISKNVVLKFNYSDGPGFLEGDPSQIRQILMNLIINASEAIEKRSGVIAVTTGTMYCDQEYIDSTGFQAQVSLDERISEGMYVFLEISDTGLGMAKATMERLFEPFFTTKYTGRGLGLSAVLGIVRGHKGMIKIYSEPEKGTSFKVLFPLYGGTQASDSLADKSIEPENGWQGTGTFLIADDEESVRTVGKHMLQKLGYEVITADDGQIAVQLFEAHADKIICVLLDLTMPHKDGAQVFREIRQINPDIKVILSSGYNEQDATQQFVGKGLAGFIQKPYVSGDLVKKIKEVMSPDSTD